MNDSICLTCDTIIVKMDKIAVYLQPFQQSKATNMMDVFIALAVCIALVLIAWIVLKNITQWKKDKLDDEEKKRNAETIKEEKDKRFKLMSDYRAKVLDYMKDKQCTEDDAYIKQINEYISAIREDGNDKKEEETQEENNNNKND